MTATLAKAVVGGRRPSQLITWQREDGSGVEPLTGATITGKIRRQGQGSADDLTGTFTVTDASNGVFRWDYSTADVATTGTHKVQFTATFGSDPTPAKTFISEWVVKESL